MRTLSRSILLAALGLAITVGPFVATADAQNREQVCKGLSSGKIDTSGEPDVLVITAPDGYLISGYCVKAGSANQGEGPYYVSVEPPTAEITISHPSQKAISHYSLEYVPDAVTTTTVPEATTSTTSTTVPEAATTTTEAPGVATTTTLPESAPDDESPEAEAPEDVATLIPGPPTTAPNDESVPATLPHTGWDLAFWALLGLGLMAIGFALVRSGK